MAKLRKTTHHLLVCTHKTCMKDGAHACEKALKRALDDLDVRHATMVTEVDCLGQCGDGPVVVLYPEGIWYGDLDADGAERLVEHHLKPASPPTGHSTAPGLTVLRDLRQPPR